MYGIIVFPFIWLHFDGLMQKKRNSIAYALELRLFNIMPLDLFLGLCLSLRANLQSTNDAWWLVKTCGFRCHWMIDYCFCGTASRSPLLQM